MAEQNSEFEYNGDVQAFHQSIATLAEAEPEVEEEQLPEGEAIEEPKEPEEPEEPDETGDDLDDDPEEEESPPDSLSKEELERIFNDPEAQKVLKNRYIRELKQERKEWDAEKVGLSSELAVARKQVEAYQRWMEDIYKQQAANGGAEEDDFEPIDKEAHERYTKEIDAIKKDKQAAEEQQKLAQVQAAYNNDVNRQFAEVKETMPDINDAVQHIAKIKFAEFKRLGVPETEAAQKASDWLNFVGQQAWAKGENVAQAAYQMAQEWGYQKKAPAKPKAPNLDAIRKNQKLTAPERPTSSVGLGDGVSNELPVNEHGEVDPKKFQEMLAKYS